jgi:hypothetical protein
MSDIKECIMKGLIAPLLIGATLATSNVFADDSLKAEIEALKAQMAELKKAQEKIDVSALSKQLSEVKAHDAGDNIKWSVDMRTAYDVLEQKMTSGIPLNAYPGVMPSYTMGNPIGKKTKRNSIWTNKLILGMAAQPTDNLVFHGALGFYKTFGESSVGDYSMFQDFDWYGTQKPQGDANIRLRQAYFLYFGQAGDIPYTASFGRRPSVDGFITNLRADNAHPESPIGHNINMEFDGASFKFDLENVTGLMGFYAKICLGRGFSDTVGSYSWDFGASYGDDYGNPDMDLAGLLMQVYNDGQYKVMANIFQGWNMMGMGMDIDMSVAANGSSSMTMSPNGFHDVGDMTGGAISLQVNGIGDEINDFLDDTIAFASFAWSTTDPNNVATNRLSMDGTSQSNMMSALMSSGMTMAQAQAYMGNMLESYSGKGMLGNTDKKTGTSIYLGVNMPGFFDSDRVGLEYNHGSKYWRSYTYGEDTLVGSKLATRGDAYEIYYSFPIVGKNLTGQIRYTYIDYDYAGSNMFFGQTGDPAGLMGMVPYVDKAQDLRLSLRYRY